jgi:hypothetical protein
MIIFSAARNENRITNRYFSTSYLLNLSSFNLSEKRLIFYKNYESFFEHETSKKTNDFVDALDEDYYRSYMICYFEREFGK